MPLIFQHRIYRPDLQANPLVHYVFGDNLQRTGFGGQAKEMRGEPNAIGVATKVAPSMEDNAFFTDNAFCRRSVIEDLDQVWSVLNTGQIVVWPLDGIGTGYSQLSVRAPRLHQFILDQVEDMRKL